jgi:DNA-directed RNA polymerase subunit beta
VKAIMIDKLVQLLEGKTSQGIKHRFGEEMIAKGVKFNRKNITEGMFPEKNPTRTKATTPFRKK